MAEASIGRRLRVAIVTPGFVVERDEPGMPAIVDLVERIASVHDCEVIALRHPPARPPYRVAGARVTALGVGAASGAPGRARVLAARGRGRCCVVTGAGRSISSTRSGPTRPARSRPSPRGSSVGRSSCRCSAASSCGSRTSATGRPSGGVGGGRSEISLRGADLVTAGSSTALAAIVERRPERPVALLPLGVDTTVFRPADRRRPTTADAERRTPRPADDPVRRQPRAGQGPRGHAAGLRPPGRRTGPALDLVLVGDGRLRGGAGDVGRRDRAGRAGPVRGPRRRATRCRRSIGRRRCSP